MFLVGLSLCARAQIRDTLIISQSDVTIELDGQGYHHIKYGSNYVMEAGAPELPIVTKQYYIPHGATDVLLTTSVLNGLQILGEFNVYPSQGLVPITQEERPFIELSEEWGNAVYPSTSAEIVSDSRIFGYRIVTVCYHPFVYNAGNGALTSRNVAISLDYTIGAVEDSKASQSAYRRNKCLEYVKNLVENPELLNETEPVAAASTYSREVPIRLFAEGRPIPDFIIITNEELKPAFKQLAEWKTRRGIFTVIETTEYIDSVCLGIDLCEKIRNYIKEKEEHWGDGLAILLGGGIDIIPARTFLGHYGYEVTDMYYIDDSNVMPNHRNEFDNISLSSTIGRFPVDNIEEARMLVMKNLIYEWAEEYMVDYSYVNNALITSSYLGARDLTQEFGGGYMSLLYDYVISTNHKKHWFLFDYFNQSGYREYGGKSYKLTYTKTGIEGQGEELSRESFLSALSNGRDSIKHFHFIYHTDHSGPFSIGASQYIKGESVTIQDVMQLNNITDYYQVILSGGCHPADFSTSCIGKEFLMKPMSGAVAFMGNTDVGVETEHFALDVFYKTMYNDVKWDWETHLGSAWTNIVLDTEHPTPRSRFHILGDPTLAFWTKEPQRYQNNYSLDNDFLTVTRPNELVGTGSTICVYKKDEVYLIDTLCNRKEKTFYLRDIKSSGYVYITTTGIGQSPQRDSIYFNMEEEGLLEIDKVELMRNGNEEQNIFLTPGETFALNVTYRALKNNIPNDVILHINPVEDDLYVDCINSNSLLDRVLQQGDTCKHSFYFRIKNEIPNLTEHNKNGLEFNLFYSNEVCNYLGKYAINVIRPELFVHSVETNPVNENVYDVKIDLHVNGKSSFVGKAATFTPTNDSVIVEDSVKNFAVLLNEDTVGELSFRLSLLNNEVNSIPCILSVLDTFGNKYRYTINPFAEPPQPPSYGDIKFYSGVDCIDIKGNFSQVNCTTTGEIFDFSNTAPDGIYFRHQPLEPMTRYTYEFKKKENGIESDKYTCSWSTESGLMTGFPSIVENSSAFLGLINAWDVDNDGKQEIFGATWDYLENDGSLIAVKGTGEDLFRDNVSHVIESFAPTEGNFMSGLAIGELYDDGEQYIVGVTYNDDLNTVNSVYCYRSEDNDKDGFPDLYWRKDTTLINSPCSPIIADLDNDDICEILLPSRGNIIIFEANGEIRKIIANLSNSYKQPAVANVIPNSKGKQIIVPSGIKLDVYDSNGNKQNDYCVNFSDKASSPIICDYDNDGYKEAIVGELIEKDTKEDKNVLDSIYIYAVKYDSVGTSMKKLFGYTRHLSARMDASFVVGDEGSDKRLEIFALSDSPGKYLTDSLIKFHDSNVSKKRTSVRLSTQKADSPSMLLADVNGDSMKEIIFPEGDSYSYLSYNKIYSSLGLNLTDKMHSTINEGLMACDIDNDGFTEIICGTLKGRLYVWKTKGNPEKIEWGSYRANPQNTGEYGKIVYPKLVDNEIYSSSYTIERDFYVMGNVTFSDTVSFAPHRKIVVWRNGVLNIDGATFNNARIVVKPGGRVNITDGTVIKLRDKNSFIVPKGAHLIINNGKIMN